MAQGQPTISEVIDQIVSWLTKHEFDPALRKVSSAGIGPPSVYPHIAVLPESEEINATGTDVTAAIGLMISCSSGRPNDALRDVRSIAHQVRVALNRSHGLGGLVKVFSGLRLDYTVKNEEATGMAVVSAKLALEAKYCINAV